MTEPPVTGQSVPDAAVRRRGVVAVTVRSGRFLVIRRSQTVVAPGAYCFPGGAIESGESEEAALVREMAEELAVAVRPLRRIWHSITPWGVDLAWWLAEFDGLPEPNPAEVGSVHWLSAAEVLGLSELLESNRHFFAALERGEIRLDEA